ncbi:MAG: aminotransferase class IV, partial [Pseudomonadota bacterium]
LDGITRRKVLQLAADEGLTVRERNFTLTDVYNAEESFVTGTFAGLVPVREVDGRRIGPGARGPVVTQLQEAYRRAVVAYIAQHAEHHPGRSAS